MNDLDRNLMLAWGRLGARERARRRAAAARGERGTTLARPNRAWCVCVRASDRRITKNLAEIWPQKDLPDWGEPHWVRLDAEGIRELIRPVWLDWPGVPLDVAAARLGRSYPYALLWVKRGLLRVRYQNARSLGRRGKPVPVVWSERAIDPAWENGRGPDKVWGTMWHSFDERIGEVEIVARRVVRHEATPGEGREIGRGWRWVCPGVGGKGCGRRVDRLYLPLKVWGIGEAGGGKWQIAHGTSQIGGGGGGFACRECHGVEDLTLVGPKGWNQFVAHVSGGVLYGREVRRPRGFREREVGGVERKRVRVRKRVGLLHKERVRELTGLGWSRARVARALGVSERCVTRHTAELREEEGVGTRRELMRRLGAGGVDEGKGRAGRAAGRRGQPGGHAAGRRGQAGCGPGRFLRIEG